MQYIISAESPMDLDYKYITNRGVIYLKYHYFIDDKELIDDMGEFESSLINFYKELDKGKFPKTTQVNEYLYEEYFRNLLNNYDNIIHINFGSGMTNSINNAIKVRDRLLEEYPNKRLEIIDSYCSSSGYGLLVELACDKKEAGASFEEEIEYIKSKAHNIHHQFFTTDLKYFKRSGRVSSPIATFATLFGICPIMRLNYDGKIIMYSRAHGIKKAIKKTLEEMKQHAIDGENYSGKCFISHSDCLEVAKDTKDQILINFPMISDVKIFNIGTVIASHSGKGTIAVFFEGDERIK